MSGDFISKVIFKEEDKNKQLFLYFVTFGGYFRFSFPFSIDTKDINNYRFYFVFLLVCISCN
jgi:hypothetical protein